jgi:uncharacterized protein (DUF1501 family)
MKRRQFLTRMSGLLGGTMLGKSIWWPVTQNALAGEPLPNGRILVMIVLQGGNDGLNTVVPIADPLYYSMRPNLAVPAQQTLGLSQGTGLHPNLAPLMGLWDEGRMAIVRDVGYPDMNLSHFRATDIMFSGSGSNDVLQTGWLGRWLETMNPTFPTTLPDDPMAVQQGFSAGLLLQGERGVTGVVVDDPGNFYWLVHSNYNGPFNDTPPATRGGAELDYVRQIDRSAFEYSNAIQAASLAGANRVVYPSNRLGDQLSVVARLIDGGMATPVYVTGQDGYDTHAYQPGSHPVLLADFAQATTAFVADLRAMGRFQDVLVVTTSEFGRRPQQNGQDGTDHGTSAPWFVLSDGIKGGLYGGPPDLENLDSNGNMPIQADYRSVYSSVLQQWFGTDATTTATLLGGSFPVLPFLGTVSVPDGAPGIPRTRLHGADPNPGRGARTVRFDLARPSHVRLSVFDVGGRFVARLVDGVQPAGPHAVRWGAEGLARGLYFVTLDVDGHRESLKLVQE